MLPLLSHSVVSDSLRPHGPLPSSSDHRILQASCMSCVSCIGGCLLHVSCIAGGFFAAEPTRNLVELGNCESARPSVPVLCPLEGPNPKHWRHAASLFERQWRGPGFMAPHSPSRNRPFHEELFPSPPSTMSCFVSPLDCFCV